MRLRLASILLSSALSFFSSALSRVPSLAPGSVAAWQSWAPKRKWTCKQRGGGGQWAGDSNIYTLPSPQPVMPLSLSLSNTSCGGDLNVRGEKEWRGRKKDLFSLRAAFLGFLTGYVLNFHVFSLLFFYLQKIDASIFWDRYSANRSRVKRQMVLSTLF